MRSPVLLLACLAVLVLSANALRADDPVPLPAIPLEPAPKPDPAPPDADAPSAPPAGAAESGAESDSEGVPVVEALPSPKEAWARIAAEVGQLPRAEQRAAQQQELAGFLARWEASGRVAIGEDLLSLSRFHQSLNRMADATTSLRTLLGDDDAEAELRDQAASGLARILGNEGLRGALDAALVEDLDRMVLDWLERHPGGSRAEARGELHWWAAAIHDLGGDEEAAGRHRLLAALDSGQWSLMAGRHFVSQMMKSTHDLGGYAAVRSGVSAVLTLLAGVQRGHVEAARAKGDANLLRRAEAALNGLQEAERPIRLLGRPAPDWTVARAFAGPSTLSDFRGKVVVVDFWATWCPWCIKSFPAIRELLRDYRALGLEVVGVTASANAVYAQRYDLDDDLKELAVEGRVQPAAVRAGRGAPPPGVEALGEEAYPAREAEVIAEFIGNHRMDWPVVMIDQAEPAAKYALAGWPHALVLDRQGRVRYVKSGALLKDRPAAMAEFRQILEDLLAEAAE